MVVEHSFVTTEEQAESFARIVSFLRSQGFLHLSSPADELKFQRGLTKPKNLSQIEDLPQSVAMRFDRGRINLATSMVPFRKASNQHQEYLLILAEAIERQACVVDEYQRTSLESEDALRLRRCGESFGAIVKKRKFRQNLLILLLVLLVAGIICLIVFAILFP